MEQLNRVTKNPLGAEGITKPAITWLWKDQNCARRYTDAVSLTRQAVSLGRQKFERKLERGNGLCVTSARTVPPHGAKHTGERRRLLNIKRKKKIVHSCTRVTQTWFRVICSLVYICVIHLLLVAETFHTSCIYGLVAQGQTRQDQYTFARGALPISLFSFNLHTPGRRSKTIDNRVGGNSRRSNRSSWRHT